jgi:hypothetical protein
VRVLAQDQRHFGALCGGLLLTLSQAGNAVTVSEVPLFITVGVTPNVMLVVDNSGSMGTVKMEAVKAAGLTLHELYRVMKVGTKWRVRASAKHLAATQEKYKELGYGIR